MTIQIFVSLAILAIATVGTAIGLIGLRRSARKIDLQRAALQADLHGTRPAE